MRRTFPALLLALPVLTVSTSGAAAPREAAGAVSPPLRQVKLADVDVSKGIPIDMTAPEGKTRWDLSGLSLKPGDAEVRSIASDPAGLRLSGAAGSLFYSDPEGASAARRWLMPDREAGDLLRPGSREYLEIDEVRGAEPSRSVDRLRIEVEVVGIGWVHLPSGPREAVLQRALVLRRETGGRSFGSDLLVHRWVDPRAGVVAEISGPASPDGRSRAGVESASVVTEIMLGAANLRIYVDEIDDPVYSFIAYGWDRGAGTTVASLTPQAYANIGLLAAADSWDFSSNNSGVERASTTTPINASETCHAARCGYSIPGLDLDREDRGFYDPNILGKINTVVQREQRAGDVTLWLRAGAQNEGKSGGIGQGESRFCFTTQGSTTRSPVPLWRFPHLDPNNGQWYMQAGDPPWTSASFSCEQNVWNGAPCADGGLFTALYVKACAPSGSPPHTGTQGGSILKAGVVTVPSGHTFNALLVKNVADFCIFLTSLCGSAVGFARTTDYLWVVPNLGTVVRLQSEIDPNDTTTFSTLNETDIKFGLFPPRSISVTGMTDTSVSLSWDPGLDTHRIDAYRIYWDTDSGGTSSYAFNSIDNPGQASIVGTTASISGLTPGTIYYFTVTSRSTYTDPSSLIATTYESLLYPTQVSGDPSFVYPTEVMATTTSPTCIPSQEVTNLTLEHSPGGVLFCWDAGTDPCLAGYQVRGSSTPAPGGFGPVADVGLTTCWEGNPPDGFFQVVQAGTGGFGP